MISLLATDVIMATETWGATRFISDSFSIPLKPGML